MVCCSFQLTTHQELWAFIVTNLASVYIREGNRQQEVSCLLGSGCSFKSQNILGEREILLLCLGCSFSGHFCRIVPCLAVRQLHNQVSVKQQQRAGGISWHSCKPPKLHVLDRTWNSLQHWEGKLPVPNAECVVKAVILTHSTSLLWFPS